VGVAAHLTAQDPHGEFAQSVRVEGVEPRHRLTDYAQAFEVGAVTVGLAQTHETVVGVQLNDRAQREGLVNADRIQQGWVAKRDGRDGDALDCGHGDVLPQAEAAAYARERTLL